MHKQATVFVGLSGGVDSSVAALRLQKAGYRVIGVFIKVWHPDFLICNWEEERLDAMRVAAHLNIPFLTCDAEDQYRRDVAEYFIEEYKAGRTPNPDVFCNRYIKFGAFWEFAKQYNADYIATGHYAYSVKENNTYTLLRGKDENKDQSYFLWTITQSDLAHTLLPVGDSKKETIRKEAEKAKIPTAQKKDSQGICFLGHVDIPDFLSHFVDLKEGAVLNEDEERVGTHRGALVYTIGQRHGFTITNQSDAQTAHYVCDKDLAQNTITVSPTVPSITTKNTIKLTQTNWIKGKPNTEKVFDAQFRYRQTPVPVTVTKISDSECHIEIQRTVERPAKGQSCVLYNASECHGGGIIT